MTIILPEIDNDLLNDLNFDPALPCEAGSIHEYFSKDPAVLQIFYIHPCCGVSGHALSCQICHDYIFSSEKQTTCTDCLEPMGLLRDTIISVIPI